MVLACAVAAASPALAQAQKVNPDAKADRGVPGRAPGLRGDSREARTALPSPPKEASAAQIDVRQRELASLLQTARRNEKAGDIFESDVRPTLRRLLSGVFNGPRRRTAAHGRDGGESRRDREAAGQRTLSGHDPAVERPAADPEGPAAAPEGLEYRFIGTTLILLDTRGHTIVDYMTGAVPR